jgi:hypothetical protein
VCCILPAFTQDKQSSRLARLGKPGKAGLGKSLHVPCATSVATQPTCTKGALASTAMATRFQMHTAAGSGWNRVNAASPQDYNRRNCACWVGKCNSIR